MSDQIEIVKHANIYEAMSAAYREVGYVRKKRGENLNYTYAGEKDIIAEVRPAMVEHGIFCHVIKYSDVKQEQYTTQRGSVMLRSTLHAVVRFAHESGTYIDVEAVGEGSDSGDKSLNKAMTCAYKYALRQTFNLETGDDPDKDASQERKPVQNKVPEPAQAPAPKPVPEPLVNTWVETREKNWPAEAPKWMIARDIKNSQGERYVELPSEKLAHVATQLEKLISAGVDSKGKQIPDGAMRDYELKLAICKAAMTASQ